ncbi:hypothetical protein [Haloterrigena salifodinae]|uniref:hypothetical protein n=1 Tax=Haloterrigena salifodinae TaxID=2675099 RepID=UPI000F86CB4B|nr:hypothetical protein [Haloterrigena salifodinae]
MARDSSVADDDRCVGEEAPTTDDGSDGLLHRRSYMKLAGATTAAAATFGTSASAAEDYEVIPANGQVVRVGRGETFENKLIDLTTGKSFLLLVEGANSVIRNIGFEGLYRGDQFLISIRADRGDVLFENIYMGDGATKEGADFVHGPGAVFMHKQSQANLTFRRCNVQGFPNNGFYCSNTASGPSSVHFDTCFGKNNGVTTFRCASGDDVIENCVAYNDNTDYGQGYGGYTETSGRPVWVWSGGNVTIRDSHFADGPYPYAMVAGANGSAGRATFESGGYRGTIQRANGSTVTVADAVSSDPDLSVPDGVPTSAKAAASGDSSAASSAEVNAESAADEEQRSHVVLVDGDASDVTRYEFAVDGAVESANHEGASIDVSDEITDGRVSGAVADWKDAFRFDGDLEALTVDGPGTVLVDGEAVDPADYGAELPHVLEVAGRGVPTSFEISVEGEIELDGEDDTTTIAGSTVQSSVTDGSRTFRFSGAVTDVTIINGAADASVDGEEIDPADYGDHELLPHAVVIDGTTADEPSAYSFETSGAVVKSTHSEATIDEDDVIEDRTVRGVADNWADAYWFDGDIEDFTLRGHATVDVQYNVREQ